MKARVAFGWAAGLSVGLGAAVALGCSGAKTSQVPQEAAPSGPAQPDASASGSGGAPASSSPTGGSAAGDAASASGGAPVAQAERRCTMPDGRCGPVAYETFASGADALRAILDRTDPLVLGFGEAHAPAGFKDRPTVVRFTEDLLPILAPSSSSLIVELLAPPSGCEKEREATQKEAGEVTKGQAETNQSDYVKLGEKARAAGLVPDILRAECSDMKAIADAGDEGVVVMMETIARLTGTSVEGRLGRAPREKPRVLAYGGALHNDQAPRGGRERWSYAERLTRFTNARYVEVDLIVPELIQETPNWFSFPWYEGYQKAERKPGQAYLFETSPQAFTIIFPPKDADRARSKEGAK